MKTPLDKRIILTLYSHPMKDLRMRWKAHLVFEPGSTDATSAAIDMVDGEGAPVASGVFEFAGAHVRIQEGRGEILCGDFVKGKHEPGIWMHRKGMPPVPGAVTFE